MARLPPVICTSVVRSAQQGPKHGDVYGPDLVAVGSSPANLSVFSLANRARLETITLTHDMRNAIHGSEVWPYA